MSKAEIKPIQIPRVSNFMMDSDFVRNYNNKHNQDILDEKAKPEKLKAKAKKKRLKAKIVKLKKVKKKSEESRVTGHLEWDEFTNLLEAMRGHKYRVYFAILGYCGLRGGDALTLTWGDVFGVSSFDIIESKTGKKRNVSVSDSLKTIIYEEYNDYDDDVYILRGYGRNTPMTLSSVNIQIKKLFTKFKVEYKGNISTHLFRKTFGRRVVEQDNFSEKSLLLLSDVYNHSNIMVTKIYLGLLDDEIKKVYMNLDKEYSTKKV